MSLSDAHHGHWSDPDDDDPLVRRLRNLRWADVTPELRESCWRDFCRLIEEREPGRAVSAADGRRDDVDRAWRLDYTRRRGNAHGVVSGQRMVTSRSWARDRQLRPALTIS